MSKFSLELSYKNIFILKHSLEKRIEQDKTEYERLKKLRENQQLSQEAETFIKEHEEHMKCVDSLIEEMQRVGCSHGRNIFGDKYNH